MNLLFPRRLRTLNCAPQTARPQLARLAALVGVMLLAAAHASQAATITWGAATTISGDGNVQTAGTKVGAFNIGDAGVPSTTVNGVTFDPFAVPFTGPGSTTVGNFTLAFSGSQTADNAIFGTSAAPTPFSNLSAPYKTLLQSGAYDADGGSITLTMGGLTSGANYSFQWWANDAQYALGTPGVTATSGNFVTLDPNTTNADGGLGQFAIGTFTANATSQVVTFSSGGNLPILNAFQLRSVAPVPEPSTWAMMAFGVGALCLVVRRKRDAGDLA